MQHTVVAQCSHKGSAICSTAKDPCLTPTGAGGAPPSAPAAGGSEAENNPSPPSPGSGETAGNSGMGGTAASNGTAAEPDEVAPSAGTESGEDGDDNAFIFDDADPANQAEDADGDSDDPDFVEDGFDGDEDGPPSAAQNTGCSLSAAPEPGRTLAPLAFLLAVGLHFRRRRRATNTEHAGCRATDRRRGGTEPAEGCGP